MYKEFLEIVGNGNPTGSVLKGPMQFPGTISISVQNRHSRILLRDLLRGRMRKMHREQEVLEAEAQVEECLDCRARITSKELAPLHSVKSGILQNDLFYKFENGCSFREKCSYAHRQVDEQPSKRSKKNDDKSAVAMLKKNDLYKNIWQLFVNCDKNHERSGRPDIIRDTCHEWKQGPVGRPSSNARQLGCVFQDMEPPKLSSILRKSSAMQKPIQRVKFLKAIARHTKIRDQNPALGMISPGDPRQRNPNAPKFEDLSQEETEWQEQGAREAAWKLAKSVFKLKEQEEQHSSHLRKIGACLHQLLNQRKENLLSTPARRCT